jgi:hypothetical protein
VGCVERTRDVVARRVRELGFVVVGLSLLGVLCGQLEELQS